MESGRFVAPDGSTIVWSIVPRGWFGWESFSTITLPAHGTVASGRFSHWTRRGARAKIGRTILDVAGPPVRQDG